MANAQGIILCFAIFAAMYIGVSHTKYDNPGVFIPIFVIIFLLQFIPQILLHINYYRVNKDDVFSFDAVYKNKYFTHENQEKIFNLDDIKNLTLYISINMHTKQPQFLAFDNYNHGIITLKDGTRIIITSLLFGGVINLKIDEEKIEVKASHYRWAKGQSVQLPQS